MNDVSAAEYQRFRLWAGISSISLNLALAWALYVFAPTAGAWLAFLPFPLQLIILIEVGLLLLLPYEILTGHVAETWGGRSLQPFSAWIMDWLRVAVRYLVMASIGGVWLGYSYFMDWPLRLMWGWLFFLVVLLSALTLRHWTPRRWNVPRHPDAGYVEDLERELRAMNTPRPRISWVREADAASVNITPLSFRKLDLAISTSLIDHFTPREAALLVHREFSQLAANRRVTALAICMAWLLAGQFLAWQMPAEAPLQAALGGMAVFTSWCLVALFVWPTLNRVWCYAADAALLDHAAPDEAAALLKKLQQLNHTDMNLGTAKTTVFHPIPPLNERLRRLRESASPTSVTRDVATHSSENSSSLSADSEPL